jgi:hypothetical protein
MQLQASTYLRVRALYIVNDTELTSYQINTGLICSAKYWVLLPKVWLVWPADPLGLVYPSMAHRGKKFFEVPFIYVFLKFILTVCLDIVMYRPIARQRLGKPPRARIGRLLLGNSQKTRLKQYGTIEDSVFHGVRPEAI